MYSIIKLENAMRWDDTAGQNLGWVNNQTLTKFSILTPWSEFWLCGVNSDSVAWILTLRSEIWFCVVHFTPRRHSHRSGDTEFFFYSNILAKSKPKSKMNCLSPKMGSSNEKYMIVNNLPFNVWEPKIASRKRREIIHIVRRREIILYT